MERLATLISLLFVLTVVQVQAQANDYVINGIIQTGCLEKTNVTLEEALNYSLEEVEGNRRLQCFISCRLEYDRLIRGCDLLIVGEEEKEEVYETFEACNIAAQASEKCDCGFKWLKCITELGTHLFREQN